MASLRPGMRYSPGPTSGIPSRRTDGITPQPEDSRPPFSSASGPRPNPSSRIPQTSVPLSSTSRQPPRLQQTTHSRPPLTHQSQAWTSATASSGPTRPGPNAFAPLPPLRRTRVASPAAPVPPAAGSQRNALRQSPSQIASQDASRDRSNFSKPRSISRESSSSSIPQSHIPLSLDRGLTQSPAELHFPSRTEASSPHAVTIYPELDRYRHVQPLSAAATNQSARQHPDFLFRLATEGLPPPPTSYNSGASSLGSGISGSPSTRYSESPGSYSRDTTPTSISSYSPGLVISVRTPAGARVRQNSRGRASSFGKEVAGDAGGLSTGASAHPLTAIRESLNSSSSSSNGTVRDGDKKNKKTKTKRLSPLPPSPPPRKSSQGFRIPSDTESSPAKSSQQERTTRPERPPMPTSQARKPARAITASALTALPKPASSGKPQTAIAPRPVPSSRSATHPVPPLRPSRDGAPGLQSQLGFSIPVIHSNIPTALSYDRRASIGMVAASQSSTALAQRQQRPPTPSSDPSQPGQQLQSPPRPPVNYEQAKNRPSISVPDAVSESESASELASNAVREPRQDLRQDDPRQKTRTPSPNVSNFRARFPLFGRRTKTLPTQPATTTAEAKEKPPRKGPAAGTGHEGYGRLGASRRRSNSAGHLARGITLSQESQGSTQLQDPFLRDRLSPVIISGGEVVANKNTSLDLSRTDSNTSSNFQRPSLDLRNDSQVSLSSHEERNTLWPSVVSGDGRSTSASQHKYRRPSDSSDSEEGLIRPSLAYRRSIQRLQSPDQSQVHLPTPIIIRQSPPGPSSSINSLDTGILSDDSTLDSRPGTGRGRKGSVSGSVKLAPKKLTKRARSPRKWNMFGRSHSQPASMKKGLESSSTVAVTIEAASSQENKPVAFYTMIDSSEQEDGDMDIESVLREAHVLPSPILRPSEEQSRRVLDSRTVSEEDLLLLPPPPLTSVLSAQQQISHRDAPPIKQSQLGFFSKPQASPERASLSSTPQASTARSARPSRLQQVGRIPKVISGRQEQISPRSFSRPFNRASMASMVSIQVPAAVEDTLRTSSAKDVSSLDASFKATPASDSTEFLAFPPLQNSETTSTSRSSGALTFADSTAVVPDPCAPLFEDEIWDEYDDLLDEGEVSRVSKVSKVPLSVGSSQGLPFHLEGSLPLSVKTIAKQMKLEDEALESPTVAEHPQSDEAGVQYGRAPITSSMYNFDVAARVDETFGSKLSPPAGQLPPTPFSVSEFVSGYGDRSSGPGDKKKAAGVQRSGALSQQDLQQDNSRPNRASDGSVYSQVSEDNSPTAQVNLRVGSMTVSKWLTFGHVLFSPARDDMVPAVSPPNGHSVLVIDGLGNDDWSFYAAETYPAATFFNMSPRAPLPAGHGNGANAFPLSPANHHQVQYLSHADKFPFLAEIFTTVVYRFPAASPESHYRNIISESRRVLKPGGYIELSILDLDMNNMGNRTRRAVRQLKEQIHIHTPDVHLGSSADAILRLLGTKGYTDIKSCRVGVPAASAIPRSSSDAGTKETGKARKDDRSLAEMISDQNPVANESITNMVARVGRWWHGKCYGDAASSGSTDNDATSTTSMWADRAVLAECEEWGTNLKLMACYARVPDTKRVVSI